MSQALNSSATSIYFVPVRLCLVGLKPSSIRWQSSTTAAGLLSAKVSQSTTQAVAKESCLERLSTWNLIRNVAVSFFLTRPAVLKPGMAAMRTVADSKSPFLNPDSNPFLRALIKPLIYDQFCAGTTRAEIQKTICGIKSLGFAGVILCYAKETQARQDDVASDAPARLEKDIQTWLKGNLETLNMLQHGNWLGIKYTGAGQDVTEALLRGRDPPPQFLAAMHAITEEARSKGCRIWIDAEQQAIQPAIDCWTVDLMRRYNKGTDVLIYNTVQAYLKHSRKNLRHQLELAHKEGWNMGVKLVRGAYIANEIRDKIHDTKADTDNSYNSIVQELLTGKYDTIKPESFPRTRLFMAGHNSDTIRTALKLAKELSKKGELKVCPEFGQLQGMADDIGCEIIQLGEDLQAERSQMLGEVSSREYFVPKVYKCLTWGSIQECMQYLVRRAVENSAAVDRMREGAAESRKELMRRFSLRRLIYRTICGT